MAELGQIGGAPGRNFYEDQPYQDFSNLSRLQSAQSLSYGNQAAAYADPFMGERKNYQERLRNLIANPGSQESSPFFKYLMETQMNAVAANNAARGLSRSGRGAMALQDRAAGVATQSYFPQVAALTQLAQGGASPAAAGLSFERGVRSSQDQAQMAAAARAAGQQPSRAAPAAPAPAPAPASTFGLPYGGGGGSYGGGGNYGYTDAKSAGYTPSAGAGTGYIEGSGGGRADFGGGTFTTNGTPLIQAGDTGYSPYSEQPSYDPYASYDSGGYSDAGYSDFGYGDYGGDYGGDY